MIIIYIHNDFIICIIFIKIIAENVGDMDVLNVLRVLDRMLGNNILYILIFCLIHKNIDQLSFIY